MEYEDDAHVNSGRLCEKKIGEGGRENKICRSPLSCEPKFRRRKHEAALAQSNKIKNTTWPPYCE